MKIMLLSLAGIVAGPCNQLVAQKHDYVWLSGYDSYVGYDPGWGFYFGTSVLDFNYQPRSVSFDSTEMNFDRTNTSFCDSSGNLLFYTNGIFIANSLHERIKNSDSLNPGYIQYVRYPAMQSEGYRTVNGIYALPSNTNANQYYLIHSLLDTFQHINLGRKLFVTLLDMSMNGGHGEVIYKNREIFDDIFEANFAITRHANGRDWWALLQKRNSNCYHRVLIDDTGPHDLPAVTCAGDSFLPANFGSECFSPNGQKFAYITFKSGLNVYNFDRCTGDLSNGINLPLPNLDSLGWIGVGVCISPNSRFLYACISYRLYQYDLEADDILGSKQTVGVFDGTRAPFDAVFYTPELGPDGKIYISCGNGDTVYHVIERPDEKGDSCLFRQHSLSFPSPSLGVPSFPNYRLGALPASACDTLTGLNEVARAEKEKILKLYPNPATDFVTIDYGNNDWNKGAVSLEITNTLGQIVYSRELPMYSGFQKIDVHAFATGFYTACIKRNGALVAIAKFVRE